MNQPTQVELSTFAKLLSIWIVIGAVVIITALITGVQVYWWQQTFAQKEKTELRQEIAKLRKELKGLKEQTGTNKKAPINNQVVKKEQLLKTELAGREKMAIIALSNQSFDQLARLAHPEKGIRFSPFSYVDLQKDLVFSSKQISNLFHSKTRLIWGYSDENGMPIRISPKEYFQSFLYDQDYARTDAITYAQTISPGFTTSNCFEVYPNQIIVEFRSAESESASNQDTDLRSLRLVFEKKATIWYLVGIIHDQWIL